MPFVLRQVTAGEVKKSEQRNFESFYDVHSSFCESVLLQLEDLSRKSFEIIDGIGQDCQLISDRSAKLAKRVVNIQNYFDFPEDFQKPLEKEQKSRFDEKAFGVENRPLALVNLYNKADKLPDLSPWQQFRSDDINPLSLVSDPDYFFKMWREQFMEKVKKEKEDHQAKRRKRQIARGKNPERKQIEKLAKVITRNDKIRQRELDKGTIMTIVTPDCHGSATLGVGDVPYTIRISLTDLPELSRNLTMNKQFVDIFFISKRDQI